MPGMQAAAALLALTACALVRGYEHGNVPAMPQTCQAQLDALYSQYYLPIAVLPSTENCTQIIQDSLADIGGDNCPSSALLRSCFNHASQAWITLVGNCELFSLSPACDPTDSSGCKKPVSANPWWVQMVNLLWRPSTYDYGTGIVPNKGPGWQNYLAEDEGSRRRYRRLFAEGEGNSAVTTSGGCFPDFYSTQDFSNWLAGNFQDPDYAGSGSINPVGIIFWIVHGFSILSMAAF